MALHEALASLGTLQRSPTPGPYRDIATTAGRRLSAPIQAKGQENPPPPPHSNAEDQRSASRSTCKLHKLHKYGVVLVLSLTQLTPAPTASVSLLPD